MNDGERPASLGTALQQHWPLARMKLMSFLSSSEVQGPFFNPTLSQHGCLPIFHKITNTKMQKTNLRSQRQKEKLIMRDSSSSLKDKQIARLNYHGHYLLIYIQLNLPYPRWTSATWIILFYFDFRGFFFLISIN